MSTAIVCNGLEAYGHFGISTWMDNYLLAVGFFDRSKTKQRGIAASLGKKSVRWRYITYKTSLGESTEWHGVFSTCAMGREKFTYCMALNSDVGKRFLFTTQEDLNRDFYNFLMNNYKLPLLKEWMPALINFLVDERAISFERLKILKGLNPNQQVALSINGKTVSIDQLICYRFDNMDETLFEEKVSAALRKRVISICNEYIEPLEFETFDDYITKYGPSLVDNLNKQIKPLTELNPNVSTLALKTKSLFPQQAACVNGVLAAMDYGIKNTVLNMGMGTGKTIQSTSVVEASMVRKWLKQNPDKTLKDAYGPGVIKYRAIIMAPGHLVQKWAAEIEEEIPYAKTTILKGGLSQLIELREKGIKPQGKEFYILSKDFAKLDTWISPIPVQVKMKPFSLAICRDCAEEDGKISFKKGHGTDSICPVCAGNSFKPYPLTEYGNFLGLVCPECGELLIKNRGYDPSNSEMTSHLADYVLNPADFASPKHENSVCYHCGASLWGSNAMPVVSAGKIPKKPKWYKVSHFTNHTQKSKTTAFVLNGHETGYYSRCVTTKGLTESSRIYGPRKYAPAKFIKKYLKGYFDFCILDEAHKYLGDSAQGVAAHAIVKASRFTMALTGTISNGTAESFYNLFWMLEPNRMISMGYKHNRSEFMRFCKEYGCIETIYEASRSDGGGKRNLMSRGKQLEAPKVKPGISPVILGKLLLDRCLFMDISDLSKYLPKFTESVITVPMPYDVSNSYEKVISIIKDEAQNGGGMGLLSVMLQFGLSYPDKPYGREPIMHPFRQDVVIAKPLNYDEYANLDTLLPKEKALIDIVNKEIAEGRNCFIYATFTGRAEANVTWRLKELVENKCNLAGRVEIIQSESPAASMREEWFHKRASEGIKVFITNPANVETGLDFCFKYEGKVYNYPTLIFYQTGYQLATIWQASRRAFRLNQKDECRNYYLAYEDTLQAAALQIMAKKQTATAAIQGKFSTEGLSAMAKGVDTRAQLAAALAKNDMSSRESLENMFDALNKNVETEDSYSSFVPSPSYYELMGVTSELTLSSLVDSDAADTDSAFDISFEEMSLELATKSTGSIAERVSDEPELVKETEKGTEITLDNFFGNSNDDLFGFGSFSIFENELPEEQKVYKKKTKKHEPVGQVSLFDFLAE